ncbi:MAG TPA: helix-turn-helix domain-containing protein [Acidimicrobiia bacterium]|nr:helix-turn-helix domain-containing protein [Acidimicrobiia bacterium]
MTSEVRLEFFVEPFAEGRPGPHVRAAIAAVEAHGLSVDVGAFGTITTGAAAVVAEAVGDLVRAALESGADRVSVQAVTPKAEPALHVGDLRDALDHMIGQVEADAGGPLAELSREDKQTAIRTLDEHGAFQLRKAIEAVADAMGVSRITIYNYLNAIREE